MDQPGLGTPRTIDLADGVHAIVDMETIEGLHAANVGIVYTARTQVFINSGQTEAQGRFIWDYAQSKAPRREMTYLVLTHHHLDHCFASSFFDDRNALVYAHRSFSGCMAEMRAHLEASDYEGMLEAFLKIDEETCRRVVGSVHPVSPHRLVGDEVSLAINGEEIDILHLPGHTPSELVVYHPKTKTLFAGDAINERAGPVTMFGDVREWRKWVAGLTKLRRFEIEAIVPGHGNVCDASIIDEHIETLEKRIAEAV
jgi:cyclase